ncbi:MAG: hypothetical protein QSU88_07450, partial [Candidatus Methanoperedens sp.]|nr:hypothetical protein [Candidatus Methanoperedens sp.]
MEKFKENNDDRNLFWYAEKIPGDLLIKERPESGKDNKSSLWITDSSAKERRISMELPTGSWARLELQPATDGNLLLL